MYTEIKERGKNTIRIVNVNTITSLIFSPCYVLGYTEGSHICHDGTQLLSGFPYQSVGNIWDVPFMINMYSLLIWHRYIFLI